MKQLSATLHRLTGLLHPEWGLRVGAGSGPAQRSRGERGVRLGELKETRRIQGGAPVEQATRCTWDKATLEGPHLVGVCALSSLRGATIRGAKADAGARISACDLDGATLEAPELAALLTHGCALREAQVQGGALGRLELCDLFGAELRGVRVEALLGCDLGTARVVDCDLSGADLRGARFARADLRGTKLEGALVEGADFSGARGLSKETRAALLSGGARFRGAWVHRAAQTVLPSASPLTLHRITTATWLLGWLAFAGGSIAALALALRPPAPTEPPPLPPTLERTVSAEDRQRTQQALRSMREAINKAHDTMAERGAVNRSWPTLREVQDNRYDMDGDGPAELQELLVPAGLPDNLLTDSRGGVLPYCNEPPSQETLQGVDTDWHYCELTGRIFASAGFSSEATLNW